MNINIKPSKLNGDIIIPCSKSVAHRLLICASLSDSPSIISNISFNNDILATINCLRALNIDINIKDDKVYVNPNKLEVKDILDASESGSTLRFLIPLALRLNEEVTFKGSTRLMERPLSIYEEICKDNNYLFERKDNYLKVKGKLNSGNYKIDGSISSQFITGLIYSLILEDNDSTIEIINKFESKSYIDLTIDAINRFNGKVSIKDNIIYIKGNNKLKGQNISVEADESSASLIDAYNYIGNNIKVLGLNPNTKQGDRVYKDLYRQLSKDNTIIDLSDCPDLGPILIALGSQLNGATFINTRRLAIKECDRGLAMKQELSKLGVDIIVEENRIIVPKSIIHKPSEIINSHNDHRIVMSMCLLLSIVGGTIENYEAVNKSFKDYFKLLKEVGLKYDY